MRKSVLATFMIAPINQLFQKMSLKKIKRSLKGDNSVAENITRKLLSFMLIVVSVQNPLIVA